MRKVAMDKRDPPLNGKGTSGQNCTPRGIFNNQVSHRNQLSSSAELFESIMNKTYGTDEDTTSNYPCKKDSAEGTTGNP